MVLVASLVIAALLLVNALYVAAEFAEVSVRRSRLRQLAEDGHWLAQRLLPYVEDPHKLDRYIAASQIGITLTSLILGAYGQRAIAPHLAPTLAAWTGTDLQTANSVAGEARPRKAKRLPNKSLSPGGRTKRHWIATSKRRMRAIAIR